MEVLRCICLFLCLSFVLGDLEEQMEQMSSQMVELSEKLDREVSAHRQNMAHMSAIMEGVSLLLHKVEVCEQRNATASPPVTSPTQANKPRPPVTTVDDSWRDEVAQAACTGLQRSAGWMFAVRRKCDANARNCMEICASLAGEDSQVTRMQCQESLHVYAGTHPLQRGLTTGDVESLGTKVYRYFSCTGTSCGPNFCCCKGI